jgi:GT2 family glycosyltransferase
MSPSVDSARPQHVTAVIVAHDGERWLPRLITSLAASGRSPDRVVAVDTGSVDGSHGLLVDALGASAVVVADRSRGFGDAVRLAASAAEGGATSEDSWLWLLHDDCAPAADALECLLTAGVADSSIGVAGCRVRAWPRGRRLLEVGLTLTGTGHRETGVEPGEYDQGQYDQRRDTLSVSSAGMLVRRSLWDRLDGFEPRLPLFADDLDFGWRAAKLGRRVVVAPGAVVFHVEAASRGARTISCTTSNPHRAGRRAVLFTLLANCQPLALPFLYVRLLLGSALRVAAFLVGKVPAVAWNEAAATVDVLGRPDRIVTARARRRSLSGGNPAAVRALLPRWWAPYANGVDLIAGHFAGRTWARPGSPVSSTRHLRAPRRGNLDALETGPVPDEAVNVSPSAGRGRTALAHPLLTLLAVLAVAGLLASRGLWGPGYLQGGGLLPAPDSATGWWRAYGSAWHPVRLGSTAPTAPYVVALAVGASALLGKSWLLVDLLMMFAPVLAAAGAFVASGRLVSSPVVRVWMAATYALLPVVTGCTSAGRVGTVVATILLPWLVLPTAALFRSPGWPWRPTFGVALVLALLCSFTPVAGVLTGVLLVAVAPWLVVRHRATVAICGLVALMSAGALLLPWSLRLVTSPSLLFSEAGRNGPSAGTWGPPGWQVAFGRLGVPDQAPWLLTAGVTVAALLALLRADSRARVAAAWAVGAVALAVVAVLSRQHVQAAGATVTGSVWLGFPMTIAQAAAVVAAGLGADGVSRRISAGSFGWRQPVALAAALIGASAPVGGLLWWAVTAPHGELHRDAAVQLPAYMADALSADGGPRALVITGTARRVSYDVLAGDGVRLGDDSVLPSLPPSMTTTVRALLAPAGSASVAGLRARGVGYVVSPRPVDPAVVARMDATPDLTRASTAEAMSGWQVQPFRSVVSAAPDPDDQQSTRTWQLVGQGALWVAVLVGASPGLSRPGSPIETSAT